MASHTPTSITSGAAIGSSSVTRALSLDAGNYGIAGGATFGAATILPVTTRGVTVYIGGVDRTAWVEPNIKRQLTMGGGSKASCTLVLNNHNGRAIVRPQAGDEVIVYEGTTRFFAGVVDQTSEYDYSGTAALNKITVQCLDYGALCDRRIVHRHLEVWEGGIAVVTMAVIARENLADLGIVFYPYVADPGVNLGVQNFNGITCTEAYNQICQAVNRDWRIDFYRNLHLIDKSSGYAPAPIDLVENGGNWSELTVQRESGRYRNRVGVRNSQDLNTLWSDTFHGDGQTRMWVPNAQLKARPSVFVNGAEKVVTDFTEYSGDWDFYWLDFSIVHNPAKPALTALDTIEVYYPSQLSYIAWAQDDAEIALYGKFEGVEEVKDIPDLATLQATAAAILDRRKQRPVTARFTTRTPGFEPGQLLTAALTRPLLNETLLVTDVSSEEVSKSFGFRHQVTATSSQLLNTDSIVAYYQRVSAQARQAADRITERIGFTLAETIDGEENPGLSVGVKRAVQVATKNGHARICSLYFNSANPTTSMVEIDLLKNGVSIFGTRKMEWPAGATAVQQQYVFSTFPEPLTVREGDVFTVAVLQADENAKDGALELVVTG